MEEENKRYPEARRVEPREPEGRLAARYTERPIEAPGEEAPKPDYNYTPRLDASDLIDHSRGRLVRRAGGRKIDDRLMMRETERPMPHREQQLMMDRVERPREEGRLVRRETERPMPRLVRRAEPREPEEDGTAYRYLVNRANEKGGQR